MTMQLIPQRAWLLMLCDSTLSWVRWDLGAADHDDFKIVHRRARETAGLVKCLLCKREDLSLIPSAHEKAYGCFAGETDTGEPCGFAGQAS